MFITKRKYENRVLQVRNEAFEKGYDAASANHKQEFHISANQVALEASRGAVDPDQTYNKTYGEVYQYLVSRHSLD